MTDEVKKPKHYKMNEGDIECIDYIRQVLGPEGFIHYCHGNLIKYQHRYKYKGKPLQDLEKGYEYMGWMIDAMKGADVKVSEPEVVVGSDGIKHWYLNGKRHREDGPAVESADGSKEWWLNGKLHREDGPAFEGSDGYRAWYLNGKRHREDGPAVEWANGSKEWYLNGMYYSKAEWKDRLCQF